MNPGAVLVGDLLLILAYAGVLWIPGAVVLAAAGTSGWTAAAAAPLVTYALAGLAGPWTSNLGIPWTLSTLVVTTVALAAALASLRWLLHRSSRGSRAATVPTWSPSAHLGVALCVASAFVVSTAVVLSAYGTLATIPQDWDAVFHAASIRLIAESQDGGLYVLGQLNTHQPSFELFYPNAYHLVGAVFFALTGAPIPDALNAHTALITGMLALSAVAMVRRCGGRPALAAATAVTMVAATAYYDMLWRGPVLPYATGIALVPVSVALAVDFLDSPTGRTAVLRGAVFGLGLIGLLCIHPAILASAIVFTVPALILRWVTQPGRLRGEPLRLGVAGAGAALACVLQLRGALGSAGELAVFDWPAELSAAQAVGTLLTWQHGTLHPQWWLTVALGIGLLRYRSLGSLRWIGGSAVLFGGLFVAAAAYDTPWAATLTTVWWNDRWRLVVLAAVPLCVIAAHGLAEAQRGLVALGTAVVGRIRATAPSPAHLVRGSAGAAVLLAFVVVSDGLYLTRNADRVSINTGDGPALSEGEIRAMAVLRDVVPPGVRVMNDRGDGSAWLYALTGVQPVAGHYSSLFIGPDAALLAAAFNQYDVDPAVRAAADRLDVGYVMIGRGFLRPGSTRQVGLTDLDEVRALDTMYQNPDAVIYRLGDEPVDSTRPQGAG